MSNLSSTKNTIEKILRPLDRLSANPNARRVTYAVALIFFVSMILIPPIIGVVLKWNLIGDTLQNPILVARAESAILASFAIASIVSILDLIAGLPTAWFIVRRKAKWINVVDTLADIPFVIPTVALGFSILVFWSQPQGISGLLRIESLISPGLGLIMLLHFAFSYPIIVRIMVGELQSYDQVYEIAGRTLGASSLTAARTITLPILKPALVSAFLLAFCRSLSETGATAVVAGAFENGPIFIRNALSSVPPQQGPMVLVSLVLIVTSCAIFAFISILGPRLRFPVKKVWPNFEKRLSNPKSTLGRDGLALIVFAIFVAIPSLFVALPGIIAFTDGTVVAAFTGAGVWGVYWGSLLTSYVVALAATLMNLLVGFPMAVIITRRKFGTQVTALLNALISIPITIPSVALGVSLSLFWTAFGNLPELWTLILVHTTITYTYFVQAMAAAIESVPEELESVARTLGAHPFETFRKILIPLTKYSIFSGAIMVLTRSVDETGATTAVLAATSQIKTAPVLLVNWIRNPASVGGQSVVGLGVLFLVLTTFISLLVIRLVLRRER
ncbi:MAG: hypothetical protein QG670_36 [Thermoproteota archaeon]|nr:hypothetical protein [Thermoproteota archaeon]